MREIYDEYLHVPKKEEGTVTEKVFLVRFILSIACIIICTCAIGYNAYAFFMFDAKSTTNTLKTATYSLDISVEPAEAGQGSVVKDDRVPGRYILQPGEYVFTLKKSSDSSASTGYCRIDVDEQNRGTYSRCIKSFYTQQIGQISQNGETVNERTVIIRVDKESAVKFISCWGTYFGGTQEEPNDAILADDYFIQYKDGVAEQLKVGAIIEVIDAIETTEIIEITEQE